MSSPRLSSSLPNSFTFLYQVLGEEIHKFASSSDEALMLANCYCMAVLQNDGRLNGKLQPRLRSADRPLYEKISATIQRARRKTGGVFGTPAKSDIPSLIPLPGHPSRFKIDHSPDSPPCEAVAIGDAHGDFSFFVRNLAQSGVIADSSSEITNPAGETTDLPYRFIGEKDVVIAGDIVADRKTQGFPILGLCHFIRKQMKGVHAELTVLAGNHEDFMLTFLLNRRKGCHGELWHYFPSATGLKELAPFHPASKHSTDPLHSLLIDYLNENQGDVLKRMRDDPHGHLILREMCQMQLCHVVKDTLFLHTDPTDAILKMILEEGADRLNDAFRQSLARTLLEGGVFDETLNTIFDTFLFTGNRTLNTFKAEKIHTGLPVALNRDYIKTSRTRGIRKIVFGHSNLGHMNRIFEIEGILFINTNCGIKKPSVSAAILEETSVITYF